LAGVVRVDDKTLNGLEKKIGELETVIKSKKTTTRKVIAYELEACGGDDGFGNRTINSLFCPENGVGVKLTYRVCEEESVDGKRELIMGGRYDSFLGRCFRGTVIDWSNEREAFFRRLYENLSSAAVKAHQFLHGNEDPTQLIDEAIAKGAGMLLGYNVEAEDGKRK
jgi:hypothetical protein